MQKRDKITHGLQTTGSTEGAAVKCRLPSAEGKYFVLPSTALMPLPENSIREKTKTLCADLHQASVPQVVGRRWSQLLSVRDGGKKSTTRKGGSQQKRIPLAHLAWCSLHLPGLAGPGHFSGPFSILLLFCVRTAADSHGAEKVNKIPMRHLIAACGLTQQQRLIPIAWG